MLKRDGYDVTTAADGEQALAVLQRTPIHVVVTDLVMPRLGGMELLERVRAEYPDVPVILITAHDDDNVRQQALREGAVAFMVKPFDGGELLEYVARAANSA